MYVCSRLKKFILKTIHVVFTFLTPSLYFCYRDEDLPDHEKDFINRTLTEKVYVHVRPLDPAVYLRRKPGDLTRLLWMKVDGEIGMNTGLDKHIFQCKIVNIFLPIVCSICFGCSKEPSH